MFSFKSGKEVALIRDGQLNGEILFVRDTDTIKSNKSCCKKCSKNCYQDPCCKKCKMCKWGTEPSKDLKLKDAGHFEQLPSYSDRVLFIAGPSGSGKSTYAGEYIDKYLKIYPKAKFYVFSQLSDDPAFDYLRPHRIKLDESLIADPIEVDDIEEDSIVLFDDIDSISDKKIQLVINKLKEQILNLGRHRNIRIICTNHLLNPNERCASRTLLNEANTITFFPQSGSAYQITYCLKRYLGFSNKMITQILALPSRWVTVFKTYPQIILSDKRVLFPSEL